MDWLDTLYAAPLWMRVLAIVLLLGAVALVDFVRHAEKATKWREYAFWATCAAVGAAVAIGNDLITSRLSNAYFTLGKGIETSDPRDLILAVLSLATHAGLVAGFLIGGVILMANNPSKALPQLPYRTLAGFLAIPVLAAAATAIALGAVTPLDIQGLTNELRPLLSEDDVSAFLLVQRIHAGLYLGAVLGTAAAVALIRRRRRALLRPPA